MDASVFERKSGVPIAICEGREILADCLSDRFCLWRSEFGLCLRADFELCVISLHLYMKNPPQAGGFFCIIKVNTIDLIILKLIFFQKHIVSFDTITDQK